MSTLVKIILVMAGVAILVYTLVLGIFYRNIDRWNWETLDTSNVQFPSNFVWGTASAAYQVEGGHGTFDSWGRWETQTDAHGKPRTKDPSGRANDEWRLYPIDIKHMQDLGVNSYRFSLSWSKIEPVQGQYDESVLAHYDELIDALLDAGITPMITLHHFSHPSWFEDAGAFDDPNNTQNIQSFVDFSALVFKRYGDRVPFWATFNEPAVYAYGRHIDINYPTPFESPDFTRLGKTLQTTLMAHDAVYHELKKLPHGDAAQIGIVKSLMQMDPANQWDAGDVVVAHYAHKLFVGAYLNYFIDGSFNFNAPPIGVDVVYNDPTPDDITLDFIGLNYYSHNAFDFNWFTLDLDEATKPLVYPGEVATDLPYGYYPEGLYRAIREVSDVGKPIYITENGIGVGRERDELRTEHLKTALYGVSKAIADGYDVRGYYYWSLNDNFEWEYGYSKQFGLYEVNRETLERTPKPVVDYYQSVIERF